MTDYTAAAFTAFGPWVREERIPSKRKPPVLTLSREDEVKSKIAGVQKVKDTLADIDVSLRAGVRERIQQAVDTYFEYARQIGINNPMLSPADIFARPDVQALWGQEAGSLVSWLDSRISEGYNKGVDLASPSGPVNDSYLQALRADARQYLQTLGGQVQAGVWNAYNSTPWVSSYQQGGTSTNVPHDTAVLRWQRAQANQRAAVTDISKRAHAGIGSATQRGYTDGQLADVTDPTMLKMWVANFAQDPERGPCLTCIALHGTTIPVTESFDASVTFAKKPLGVYGNLLGPPRHAHCKCKLVFFAAHEEHEPVSKKMSEYATTKVAEQMVAKGFTASEVRAMPQPLFDSLWRFLRSGGWWKRLWRRLRRSG